jgi:serine/threonine protein kinase
MKTCPQCDTGYPDSNTTCPIHGVLLNEIRDLKPDMVIRQNYRIVRKLGEGAMGSVYLAEHTLMNEKRALKFLSREWSRDEGFTARFRREARTLRQVRHKNVVDSGDLERAEDDSLFFPMEFVDGPDLRSFLHTALQPFDVGLALAITRGIAEGLGAAHVKGMVHRDIKPENILIARDGDERVPKIVDFGIVAIKESRSTLTRTGGTLLTMNYAAPEQWRGTPAAELDGRTDLYALGGVLFEMLTGKTPFRAENYEGWAEQHRYTVPQPPSTIRSDLTNWQGLDALVLRLLAKDREDRPKDVAELVGLIDQCLTKTKAAAEEWLKKGMEFQGQERYKDAFVCFERGIQLNPNHPELQFMLGSMYSTYEGGKGVTQDYAQADAWYRKAAEQGHSGAQYIIGLNYDFGDGVIQDYAQAAFWYRKAADQGHSEAQKDLGQLYESGEGVQQDYVQAAFWYRKAAEQGDPDAQQCLGSLYEGGQGIPQDYAKAEYWYRKTADYDYPSFLVQLHNNALDRLVVIEAKKKAQDQKYEKKFDEAAVKLARDIEALGPNAIHINMGKDDPMLKALNEASRELAKRKVN